MNYYDENPKKLFWVDYIRFDAGVAPVKTAFLLIAASRKNAETLTREMEAPSKINVFKITPCPLSFGDDVQESEPEQIEA